MIHLLVFLELSSFYLSSFSRFLFTSCFCVFFCLCVVLAHLVYLVCVCVCVGVFCLVLLMLIFHFSSRSDSFFLVVFLVFVVLYFLFFRTNIGGLQHPKGVNAAFGVETARRWNADFCEDSHRPFLLLLLFCCLACVSSFVSSCFLHEKRLRHSDAHLFLMFPSLRTNTSFLICSCFRIFSSLVDCSCLREDHHIRSRKQ